jgi:MoaA/NifB/PqqE/SkfB family radical SAM enzyme
MKIKQDLFNEAVNQIISNKMLRGVAVKQLDKQLYKTILNDKLLSYHEEKLDRYYFLHSVMMQVRKNLDKGFIKKNVVRKMTKVFIGDTWKPNREAELNSTKIAYKEKYGEYPPRFLVLSPEKACNLKCTGCYASCVPGKGSHLDFETSRRIVREAHDIFGSRFITISGGEPFMYRSNGKTIIDLFEEFSDMFFLIYTNGTLITKEVAKKLAELGNATPGISVEGYESETDERRGKGVHKKILQAMENLREEGVPFGVSVTATTKNYETLLTDDFYKYYFENMGATYMWQFQLMPIGRGKEVMELMITPQQRVELYKKWEHVCRNLEYPFADFWNSGSLSTGCIAYARWNGYFYIDFDGKVMPCVFVPYYISKIQDIYANGGTLADAIQSKLFENGRKWQKDYGFCNEFHKGNIVMPCSIRDHYNNFKQNILTDDTKGADIYSEEAVKSDRYEKIMVEYDQELEKLTEEIYEEKYLKSIFSEIS